MIGHGPSNERCAVCCMPLEADFILWMLPRDVTLVMHAGCTARLSSQLKAQVHRFYKHHDELGSYSTNQPERN